MKKILFTIAVLSSVSVFAQQKIQLKDTIPFTINEQNTLYVKAVFNEKDTLDLNFDTGTTELVLTNSVMKTKLKSVPKLYNTIYNLKIGTREYKTKVYDAELTGHGTDGRFGWDLFKGKVVEINYDKHIIVIHESLPASVLKDKAFSTCKITYFKELPLIVSTITQSGIDNTDSFLFDTGYQRTAMLDDDLLKAGKFPTEKMEVIKKVMMKGAQGNEVPVITANLETLRIGNYELKNVPVQQITTNKPLRGANIHILGNEVLKRFNTFLDLQNDVVYLKPNQLFSVAYIEQK
ncbi:clan AA aspartic protease [Taibaiella sp. KBW10]|uniref:aspartyl protease family protein n=1 Tax=Taibaiella sp. KBW10 TaxID=2153357 RepID=UPI000F59E893|nr:aspartyl protease family protein [Taibaiella sp. KBW10]RQO30861.1 clan AA aspartic protease [Taibaiella sp. KBW10]